MAVVTLPEVGQQFGWQGMPSGTVTAVTEFDGHTGTVTIVQWAADEVLGDGEESLFTLALTAAEVAR